MSEPAHRVQSGPAPQGPARGLLVFLLSGCVLISCLTGCSRVEVRVDTWLADSADFPWPDAGTFRVVAETDPVNPLFEQEVAARLGRMLTDRGYRLVRENDSPADYLLACWFGVDDGRVQTETVAVHEPPLYRTTRYYSARGRLVIGHTYWSGRTRYVPHTYTIYQRRLILTLYKGDPPPVAQQQSAPSIIWRATAESAADEPNLRRAVPYLLAAAFEYWSEDSNHQRRIAFRKNDKRLRRQARRRGVGETAPPTSRPSDAPPAE